MDWGKHHSDLADRFEARNIPLPAHLILPEIGPGGQFALEAFWDLSADRQAGLSIGFIPFISIHFYAERYGIGDDEFHEFFRLIRACDRVFVTKSGEKNEANSG